MNQALTPGQLNAISNVASTAAIMLGVPLIVCGAGELWRRWREAGQLADRLADPGSGCRWCESLIDDGQATIDDCDCDEPCDEYKSWCAARRAARKGPDR